MGLELNYIEGQTPLDEDEKEGLLIPTIATRRELDEFEQLNIEDALQWIIGKSFDIEEIVTESFIRNIHQRMFGNVWSWAGQFRKTNKNLGVDKHQIPVSLKNLCDDVLYWVKNETYLPEEIAIRFKHRIVSIHCFSNGNGRHSRFMADIIVEKCYKLPSFSWGAEDLVHQGKTRSAYLDAVRCADAGDIHPLMKFARS